MKPSEPGLERQDFGPRMCDARVKKKKSNLCRKSKCRCGVSWKIRIKILERPNKNKSATTTTIMQIKLCSVLLTTWFIITGPLETSVKGQFQQSASILHGKLFFFKYLLEQHLPSKNLAFVFRNKNLLLLVQTCSKWKKKKNWGLWQVFNFFSRHFFQTYASYIWRVKIKRKQLSNDNFNRQLQFYNSIYLPAPHCNNTLAFFL